MNHPVRPECAGYHEPDPICDGSDSEPICEYRDRCLALITIAGGKAKRTVDGMKALLGEWDDDRLDEWFEERKAALAAPSPEPPPKAAAPAKPSTRLAKPPSASPRPPTAAATSQGVAALKVPGFGRRVKKTRPAHDVHPRPEERFGHVLPVVDAIVERLARELNRDIVLEGDSEMRVGQLFLRYTPGMAGRLVALYEATAKNTYRHKCIARFVLLRRYPRLNMKVNSSLFPECIREMPPTSVECRLWKDTAPTVALVGVDAHSARESAQWLSRLYLAGLIGGRT